MPAARDDDDDDDDDDDNDPSIAPRFANNLSFFL